MTHLQVCFLILVGCPGWTSPDELKVKAGEWSAPLCFSYTSFVHAVGLRNFHEMRTWTSKEGTVTFKDVWSLTNLQIYMQQDESTCLLFDVYKVFYFTLCPHRKRYNYIYTYWQFTVRCTRCISLYIYTYKLLLMPLILHNFKLNIQHFNCLSRA